MVNELLIYFVLLSVSDIAAIQSQLKNIYTNTLSTLCPLPWLEKAEDVQFNFDNVFIPLHTTDIAIQNKTAENNTADFLGPIHDSGDTRRIRKRMRRELAKREKELHSSR